MKPSSAIRSASSSTTIWTLPTSTSPDFSRSIRRSGVAMTISTPLASASICWCRLAPPYTGSTRMPASAATGSSTSATWIASSRVGTSTRPSGARGSATSVMRASIGTPNASVLPDPVWARPHTSRPCNRDRDRRGLDRERLGEPGGGEADVDALGHAEIGEPGRRLDGRQQVDRGEVAERLCGVAVAGDRSVVMIGGPTRLAAPAGSIATPAGPRAGVDHGSTHDTWQFARRAASPAAMPHRAVGDATRLPFAGRAIG